MTVRYTDFRSFEGPADFAVLNPNRGLDGYANGVNTYRGKIIADQATIIQHIDTGINIVPKNGTINYAFADQNHRGEREQEPVCVDSFDPEDVA